MQLFLKGENIHTLEVQGTESVLELKCAISSLEGIPAEEQVLSYGGRPLSDILSLAECGLNELATLELCARVLGGKVHGSLARAGKVKGQTPKAEPQEKKKKKTGRAKRACNITIAL